MDFNSFWRSYPRKLGKLKAERAWKRIPQAQIPAVLAGLEVWRLYWQARRIESDYIPYPATWLTGKRWEEAHEIQQVTRQRSETLVGQAPMLSPEQRQQVQQARAQRIAAKGL